MKQSYDKRMYIFIPGIKEDGDSVWKNREQTFKKFQDFLVKGLKFEIPEDVQFVDIHQLPQHPVTKNGKVISHSINTIKILTVDDKHSIF